MKKNGKEIVFDDLDELREIFDTDPRVIKLREKKAMYSRQMNYAKMFEIDGIIKRAWADLVKETHCKTESLLEATLEMEKEDRDECLVNFYSLVLMSDCFDFLLAELNEKLKKYKYEPQLGGLVAMNKLAKAAKDEVSRVLNGSTNDLQENYAIRSDELRELIKEKVRKGFYQDTLMKLRLKGCNV